MTNSGERIRVLLVDDEPDIHHAIRTVLEQSEVVSAFDVAEGLSVMNGGVPFDVALVDKNLPDRSGMELVRELRAQHPDLEVLVITGFPSMDSVIDAVDLGVFHYIAKPFDILDLQIKVRNAANKTRLTRKNQELARALKDSEARHRLLFESSPDAVLLLDAETLAVLTANPAAAKLYGYATDELVGMKSDKLLADDEAPSHLVLDASLRWHRHKGGEVFPVEVTSELCSFAGQGAVVTVVRDVSQRIQAQEKERLLTAQLLQSQKLEALGHLAAGVAHDFNNLLVIFLNSTHFLRSFVGAAPSSDERTDAEEDLERLAEASVSATRLARQLLTFGRVPAGSPELIDVNTTLNELQKLLRRSVTANVEVRLDLQEALAPVRIDRGYLEQALLNLVLNARDAMPLGGLVTLTTQAKDSRVILSVRDSGEGIAPDVLDRIFDPFFTTKTAERGTGLGLPAVRKIVDAAGGTIVVSSSPGRGTTFRLEFPAAAGRVAEGAAETGTAPGGSGQRLVVVEDQPHVRRTLVRSLRRAGYCAKGAASPIEAQEIAASGEVVDLWIVDAVLPHMSGRALVAFLRESRPNLAVVWTSGYPTSELQARGLLADGAKILCKPFVDDELRTAVREALPRKVAQREMGD